MALTEEQTARLSRYREQAFARLKQKEHRRYADDDDRVVIEDIIQQYNTESAIAYQMVRDLNTFLLYDALAMWLDSQAGLAHYSPHTMLKVGEVYFDED